MVFFSSVRLSMFLSSFSQLFNVEGSIEFPIVSRKNSYRCVVQKGFEEVQHLVPALAESLPSGSKLSKSAMLSKST